jgi:KDO2-lipid IV(A) lauroyltransferase
LHPTERDAIVSRRWDNLFRVPAEYAHLDDFGGEDRLEIVGGEVLDRLRDDDRPGLLFAGHLANWEMATVAARRHGIDLALVYRDLNNPLIDRRVRDAQRSTGARLILKGHRGARSIISELGSGGHVLMLVDQRLRRGLPTPFMGIPALTAPDVAELAYRFDAPLVPLHVERLGGARFRVTAEPPLALPRTGDRRADVAAALVMVNARLEAWISARPEQWLWVHRRWSDELRSPQGEAPPLAIGRY